MKFEEFKEKHKLLATYKYTWAPIDKGYNNPTLYINVGDRLIIEKPVTQEMKDKFIGGKSLISGFYGTLRNPKQNGMIPKTRSSFREDLVAVSPNIREQGKPSVAPLVHKLILLSTPMSGVILVHF
jgi:hypothetical protein